MYEYFRISAEDLGKDAKIPLVKLGDSGEVFYEMALEMVNTIKEHNARGEKTVFICPSPRVQCSWYNGAKNVSSLDTYCTRSQVLPSRPPRSCPRPPLREAPMYPDTM